MKTIDNSTTLGNQPSEKKEIERFEKYGIKNCAKCGKWPASYTLLEKRELCKTCIHDAVIDYRVKQIKGEQPF